MVIDLSKFCSDNRPGLMEPFSSGEYTYATNGHIMIRVPRDYNEPQPTHVDMGSKVKVLEGYLAQNDGAKFAPMPEVELPPVPPYVARPCTTCDATGRLHTSKCTHCDGGTKTCHACGGIEDCDRDGCIDGLISRAATTEDKPEDISDCDVCEGTGDSGFGADDHDPVVPTLLGPYSIDRKYVRLMQSLPGIEIDLGNADCFTPISVFGATVKPVVFRFDGGVGVIMPLRGMAPGGHAYDSAPTDPHHGGKVSA